MTIRQSAILVIGLLTFARASAVTPPVVAPTVPPNHIVTFESAPGAFITTLEQRIGTGQWTGFLGSANGSQLQVQFTNVQPGSVSYRVRAEFLVFNGVEVTGSTQYSGIVNTTVTAQSNPTVLGYDPDYDIYAGDFEGDGDQDAFVKYLPGGSLPPENADQALLVNNGDGSFTLRSFSSLTSSERSVVSGWSYQAGTVFLSDFNNDRSYDLYLDLPKSIYGSQAEDQILFASGFSQTSLTNTSVDDSFRSFFVELDKWIENPSYFEDNAPLVTRSMPVSTGTGWYYFAQNNSQLFGAQLACAIEHGSNCISFIGFLSDVFSPSDCALLALDGIPCDRFGGHVLGYTITTVMVDVTMPDYSGFNQDAVSLAQGALADILNSNGIISESAEAIEVADVVEAILGVQIYEGIFRDGSISLPDESGVDNDANQFQRLRWLLDKLLRKIRYLAEEETPEQGVGGQMPIPVLLTFDDGPNPTSDLAATVTALGAKGAKADFYVIGQEVQQSPSATASLITSGHKVQNHSFSHPGQGTPSLPELTQAQVTAELTDAQNAIIAATNVAPTRFRAPYGIGGGWGNVDPKIQNAADSLNLSVIFWDVDTEDWRNGKQGLNPRVIAQSVLEAKAFAIKRPNASRVNVLMHVQTSTAAGLVPFIAALEAVGFTIADPP